MADLIVAEIAAIYAEPGVISLDNAVFRRATASWTHLPNAQSVAPLAIGIVVAVVSQRDAAFALSQQAFGDLWVGFNNLHNQILNEFSGPVLSPWQQLIQLPSSAQIKP